VQRDVLPRLAAPGLARLLLLVLLQPAALARPRARPRAALVRRAGLARLLLCATPTTLGSARAVWRHLLVLGRRLHAGHACCGRKAVLEGVLLLLLLLLLGWRCQGLLHLLQHGVGHAAIDGGSAPAPAPVVVDHVDEQLRAHFRGQVCHLLLQLRGQGRE
jgi:hypothetical protein